MELVVVPIAWPQPSPALLKINHQNTGNQTHTEATKEIGECFARHWDNPLFQEILSLLGYGTLLSVGCGSKLAAWSSLPCTPFLGTGSSRV